MKLLVTGGSGLVGSNVVKVARERYDADVTMTVHRWRPDGGALDDDWVALDLRDPAEAAACVRRVRPDAVVHTAILNDLPRMYRERQLAWDLYVTATRALVEGANDVGAKLVLVSTDWVFDGRQPGADERTPPNPVNYYGVLKVVCETVVREVAADGAVARVAGVNGINWARPDRVPTQNPGFGDLAAAAVASLRAGEPFIVWDGGINQVATPSLASDCAEMILRIVDRDTTGVLHCCGGQAVSRLELARAAAEVFGVDPGLVETGPPDLGDVASVPFPRDTSLSAEVTAATLGVDLPTVQQWLTGLRSQLEAGRTDTLALPAPPAGPDP